MKIGIPVPNNYFPSWEFVKCLLTVADRYPIVSISGPYIYMNRNLIFERVKATGDSLLFIDSDILFSLSDVTVIEQTLETKDAVTGVYCMGQPPHPPCIFKKNVDNDYELTEPQNGEIAACGGGFLGISTRVLEAMGNEPFNNIIEGKIQHGEDISFCHRLREHGFKLWCDTSIRLGHIRHVPIYPQSC